VNTITRRAALLSAGAALLGASCPFQAFASPKAIDEQGFFKVGGIEQWVAVQGTDVANPAILFLHGGPGEAESPFLAEFVPWENDFTVINWDQRGSGKTYGKNGPSTPGMTVDRMADDAVEVAEIALKRLNKPKLVLVGHSWGAALGLSVVTRRPDLFYAFVGTGQPVTWALSLEDRERWARQQATAANDAATIKAMNDTANLPASDMKRVMASGKWRWSPSDKQYLTVEGAFIGNPPFPTTGPVADFIAGGDFTGPKLWPVIVRFDARTQFPEIPLPFFVIEGRDDHTASFIDAEKYVAQVRAPIKKFIPIDGGHFACFTNPTAFIGALRTSVMPLIGSASS
jgi:pimeloyl-ACP methyl ester carboxylesterase